MNSAIVTGKIVSKIKVMNETNANPFCKFELVLDNRTFDCLVIGTKAHKFVYDVDTGMEVTVEAIINNQMQLVIQTYQTHFYPNYFGQLFDCNGQRLSQDEVDY
ncbi:MAG: ssDNA-binding protein [Carnobacterium sp.]